MSKQPISVNPDGHNPKDPAVVLGVAPAPFPDVTWAEELLQSPPAEPPQLIDGILHQGCKLVLGGASKSNKTWCLLDLALGVASGTAWWGRSCRQTRVLYVNFELPQWSLHRRVQQLIAETPQCAPPARALAFWNLRGHAAPLALLKPRLIKVLASVACGLIVIDPVYKVLGDRDENSNTDVASLMNEIEAIAVQSGAAICIAHHFAKGDMGARTPMDRLSGAGAWARDPDTLIVLTPHEEAECYVVSSIIRNMRGLAEFTVRWEYPRMRPAPALDPANVRTHNTGKKSMTDATFMERFVTTSPRSVDLVLECAVQAGMSRPTAYRYIKRLVDAGLVASGNRMVWLAPDSAAAVAQASHDQKN